VAKFGTSNLTISCAPLQINFYDSSYYAKSWLWEFSDGKTSNFQNPSNAFFKPGTEAVKLTVTSNGGCQSVYTANLKVTGPVGNLSYTPLAGCENSSSIRYSASAVGASQFKWDFNDGTIITGTDSTITHVYKARGKFLPKVIFTDSSGCTLPIEGKDTVFIEGATAKFTSDVNVICENGLVVFKDSSLSNAPLTYRWDFGDGTSSFAKNPLPHRYAVAGNYSVKLVVVTPNNCSDSSLYSNYINVVKYPVVTILSDTVACENFTITFTAQLAADTSTIRSWLWKFGNGQTSTLQNPPPQLFSAAGTFSNSLTVVNSSGCSIEKFNSVTIQPIPKIITSDTTICLGGSIQLLATGASSFSWTPSINLSCTNCNSPFASPINDQTYIVNATSTFRCANEDSVTIKILKPFNVATSFMADSICIGETVQLQANGADSYLWTPSAGLNFNNVPNPKVTPASSILYTVVGYDTLGCFRDTASSQIVVYTYPTVELGPDIVLSAGNSQTISPVYTGVISKYIWLPSKDLSCNDCPNPILTAKDNITYRLRVQNEGGCAAEDAFSVFVTCDKSIIFIPNTFSPNNDGMNDRFYPRGNGINTISYMRVFNRWGELVYSKRGLSANDASAGWDGMYKGTKSPMGVYTYAIEIVCQNSQLLKFVGNLTLIQ
jgi:gliding motility-associated-like protein